MHNFFRVLRYLFTFFLLSLGLSIYSNVYAAECPSDPTVGWNPTSHNSIECPEGFERCSLVVSMDGYSGVCGTRSSIPYVRKKYFVNPPVGKVYQVINETFENKNGLNYSHVKYGLTEPPKDPCETPKTDAQCNKGAVAWITGNASFWATATSPDGYKGCTLSVLPGTAVIQENGDRGQDAVSTGSTGKSWCAPDPSEPPTPENELGNNSNFKPAPDNNPKNCPAGWVKTKT
ncbi:MAG: hypothetical protein ACRC9E_15485, partial [Plesiomonas shigelloides]